MANRLLAMRLKRQDRPERFDIRLTADERRMLVSIAAHEDRTGSDVIRELIRRAWREMSEEG